MTQTIEIESINGLKGYIGKRFQQDRERAINREQDWTITLKVYCQIWKRDLAKFSDVDPRQLLLTRIDPTEIWCAHNVRLQHIDSVIAERCLSLFKLR